jgi:hypothetical protein
MNRFIPAAFGLAALIFLFPACVTEQNGVVNGTVNVSALIQSPLPVNYTLEAVSATNESYVRLIKSGAGNLSIQEAIASWDTTSYPDGQYVLKLTVTDSKGRTSRDSAYLRVANHHANNTPSDELCPKWSCDNLNLGHNNVSISITKDQYKDTMKCSILCTCPEGSQGTEVYSRGYLDRYLDPIGAAEVLYDSVYLTGKYYGVDPDWRPPASGENTTEPPTVFVNGSQFYLGGNWTDNYPYNFVESMVEVRFESDASGSGADGYDGFRITDYVCQAYCPSQPAYSDSYIGKVALGQDVAASGNDGYSGNTRNTFTTLQRGRNYTLKVYVKNDYLTKCYQDVEAWIDYNQDYSFESPNGDNDNASEEPNP